MDTLDLLHPQPIARIDQEHTKAAIAMAFASGISGGLFTDALDRARVAPSSWEPAQFANDLFVASFVASCFKVRIQGADLVVGTKPLVRLLTQPPKEPAILAHRRQILAELTADSSLRGETERLYSSLCRLRNLLEGAGGIGKFEPHRRQLDILLVTKDIIDRMATGFASARSGLASLTTFGTRVQRGEPYRSLADLVRYDERLATLNLNVSVGADGRIRGFQVLSIQEDNANPFVTSPWRRWLSKAELFVRGYGFSDGEVMARLIDAVFEGIEDDVTPLVQLLGDLEFYLGALGFRDLATSAGLAVCLPDLVASGEENRNGGRTLTGLFNPLLLAHGVVPVPCDVKTDRFDTTVLITGPNSGGKTRLLQSLGLAQLLAQCGVFVPARAATLMLAPSLVVSLIEETRADQAEGRLGTELVRIRSLFERLPPGAMVILDELCSGTNPSEGEEIFELVVRMLARLAPQAFITTHFLQFAARLQREAAIPELRFLQVELSADQRPTYQFTPGVAHTSLAAHAAARLGVTGDQLLQLVERNIAQRNATNATRG